MTKRKNIFLGKKILIYGLGKSGISSYKFLNNKAKVYLFDDNLKKKINCKLNQRLKDTKEVSQIKFDKIIISPGIDISNCRCSLPLPSYYKYLNKNDMSWVKPVGHFGDAFAEVDEKQENLIICSNKDGQYNILLIVKSCLNFKIILFISSIKLYSF